MRRHTVYRQISFPITSDPEGMDMTIPEPFAAPTESWVVLPATVWGPSGGQKSTGR